MQISGGVWNFASVFKGSLLDICYETLNCKALNVTGRKKERKGKERRGEGRGREEERREGGREEGGKEGRREGERKETKLKF